eukprot:Gregarina_sp_Poly_1__2311@NODE_1618_length_3708_cov_145_999176_g1065_i0_p1_GENE_NODE_1618_length_3708_cov_145_999176_g1065_i0NODE_1618_length_3708_cov_145_999176_g1065_i0_p1_ORF_typecomplete_len269_score33_83_NODE_1618_length_3708_cov_145_999176_g1065_i027283534
MYGHFIDDWGSRDLETRFHVVCVGRFLLCLGTQMFAIPAFALSFLLLGKVYADVTLLLSVSQYLGGPCPNSCPAVATTVNNIDECLKELAIPNTFPICGFTGNIQFSGSQNNLCTSNATIDGSEVSVVAAPVLPVPMQGKWSGQFPDNNNLTLQLKAPSTAQCRYWKVDASGTGANCGLDFASVNMGSDPVVTADSGLQEIVIRFASFSPEEAPLAFIRDLSLPECGEASAIDYTNVQYTFVVSGVSGSNSAFRVLGLATLTLLAFFQ